jgi:hypothetical protein
MELTGCPAQFIRIPLSASMIGTGPEVPYRIEGFFVQVAVIGSS